MKNRWFYIMIATVVLLLNVYPLFQLASTNGYLFYMNANDEATYLQYDFSQAVQSISRISQFIVTWLHEVGVSGGWINFLADVTLLPVLIIFMSRIFVLLGINRESANLYAFLLTGLPLLFCGLNPLIMSLYLWGISSGNIYWFVCAEEPLHLFLRTPEPQFSFTLLSVVVYWALKKRSFWPVYLCLPFLYSFVSVCTAYIIIALHLKRILSQRVNHTWVLLLASYGIVCCLLMGYVNVIVSPTTKRILTSSHEPLLSVTGVICLILVCWVYRRCDPRFRFFLMVVASTPLAIANTQLMTGWLISPNHYDQYFGVLCAAVVLTFAVPIQSFLHQTENEETVLRTPSFVPQVFTRLRKSVLEKRLQWGLGMLAMLLIVLQGRYIFRINYLYNQRLIMNDELLQEFHDSSDHVAIDDVRLAMVTSMIFARQTSTLLSFERSYAIICTEQEFERYLRVKKRILNNSELSQRYEHILKVLDSGYRYEGADLLPLHLGRKNQFQLRHDVDRDPEEDLPMDIRYVLTNRGPLPKPRKVIMNWIKQAISNDGGSKYR